MGPSAKSASASTSPWSFRMYQRNAGSLDQSWKKNKIFRKFCISSSKFNFLICMELDKPYFQFLLGAKMRRPKSEKISTKPRAVAQRWISQSRKSCPPPAPLHPSLPLLRLIQNIQPKVPQETSGYPSWCTCRPTPRVHKAPRNSLDP